MKGPGSRIKKQNKKVIYKDQSAVKHPTLRPKRTAFSSSAEELTRETALE